MKRVCNQQGFSLLGVLIALVIILIVAGVLLKSSNKANFFGNPKQAQDFKKQEMSMKCKNGIRSISIQVDEYAADNQGRLPMTMDMVVGYSSVAAGVVNNEKLWAEMADGASNPKFRSYHDEYYKIEGWCNDGNRYLYDSSTNDYEVEPFETE